MMTTPENQPDSEEVFTIHLNFQMLGTLLTNETQSRGELGLNENLVVETIEVDPDKELLLVESVIQRQLMN